MTSERLLMLIDLTLKASEYMGVIADITIGKVYETKYEINVFDGREQKRSFSIYYTTEWNGAKIRKNPNAKNIITLYDPELKKAERYLRSIPKKGVRMDELGKVL